MIKAMAVGAKLEPLSEPPAGLVEAHIGGPEFLVQQVWSGVQEPCY